jgi:DNA polymerase-3 subunit alpha
MLKEFKPDKFEDIILLVAAYRPGPMQFIPDIIAVKHGRKTPDYAIPEMEEVLGVTYGYPIYQEQVMQIFNKFAGFSLGEADVIRRYMSKKKEKEFLKYKDQFIDGLVARGAIREKAETLWEQLVEFAKYAFNKSHAAAYAIVSYITAWLKYHYPAEYISCVMDLLSTKEMPEKMPGLIADCKRVGIKIMPPNINLSEIGFSILDKNILFGLSSIKNVGAGSDQIIAIREKYGKFSSFTDYLIKAHAKKDVTESLIKAGAMDSLFNNRQALLAVFSAAQPLLKKMSDKNKIVIDEGADTDSKKIKNAQETITKLTDEISFIKPMQGYPEDRLERLNDEKELLGVYVSAHPMDEYKTPAEMGCTPIEDVSVGDKVKIMGLITNLRLQQRKSDGSPMAFFTLEDLTGNIDVNCFTKSFRDYGDCVREEGKVVILEGKVFEEEVYSADDNDDVDDDVDDDAMLNTVLKFNMYSAKVVEPELPKIYLQIEHLFQWEEELQGKVKAYRNGKGNPLVLYDAMMGEYRVTNWRVSPDIMKSGLAVSMT